MSKSMTENVKYPTIATGDLLTDIIAHKAREILAAAVQMEAGQWLAERSHLRDPHGRNLSNT